MLKFVTSLLHSIVPEEELQPRVLWRTYAVIAWVSFLFAALATMVFFASFEPNELALIATFPIELSANAVYTIGFFLFWILCFSCTTCSCILLSLPLSKRQKPLPDPLHDDVE